MKILVFNSSPKKEKSDTMHITRAFLDGLCEKEQNEIHTINVHDCHIEYCSGCLDCMRNGGKCIHDDDMQEILEEILCSDLLIFSFPLYCYGMPAPLKALIDRTLPLSSMAMQKVDDHYEHIAQRDFSKLRYIMICGCGFPNSENNFEAMVMQFKMMFRDNHEIITVAQAPMFNAPEAAEVTRPFLEAVKTAGREYAENGKISEETMEKLNTPMIPHEVYAQIVNSSM
ncbi:MAG: flavodoxin family protein [Eubacterium sp.]